MSPTPEPPDPALPDPVRVASAFGAGAGLLSLAFPFFDGLVLALAALLLAGALRRRPGASGPGWAGWSHPRLVAAVLAGGWAIFLLAPAAVAPFRGLALGLAGLSVGWAARRSAGPPGDRP
jgi:hypothetical protein